MGCASIKWSVLRAYATLRNFVSPDLALRKCMSQEALGPPETRPSASQDLGEDSLSPLATVRVHFPQVSTSYLRAAEVNLSSSLPFTGKLITKFLKSDEILSIF